MVNRFGFIVRPLSRKRERVGDRVIRAALLLAALATLPAHAQVTFEDWLGAFRQDAEAQGISPATLEAAFAGITPV